MSPQSQDGPHTGANPGHPGIHQSGLSNDEWYVGSAASNSTPLNQGPPPQSEALLTVQSGVQSACDDDDYYMPAQVKEPPYDAWGKRSLPQHQDYVPNKRPRCSPATLRETSWRTLQNPSGNLTTQDEQPSCMRSGNVFQDHDGLHNHEFQFKDMATGLFTPTSTLHYEYANKHISPGARHQSHSPGNNEGGDRHGSSLYDSDNDYPIDSENENDMLQLLNSAEACIETHMPPSSVLNRWDRDSRSADVYDQNLQYSPIQPSVGLNNEIGQDCEEEDSFLDEDVDWDAVYAISSSISQDASLARTQERKEPNDSPEDTATTSEHHQLYNRGEVRPQPLASFSRPEYPGKAHDRSVLRGLSSEVVLRTCFHIEEMLRQAAHCYNHNQEVVFELYAKVKYSKREGLARKQYFLLVDLFEEDKEFYLLGSLSGWRAEDLKDRQGQAFLETSSSKMCRCMCKAKRDSKNATGWVLDILDIIEADWEQIRHARMILGENNNGILDK
ncbi:hypothetical protein PGQ11_000719 [Apiospora arundinis]